MIIEITLSKFALQSRHTLDHILHFIPVIPVVICGEVERMDWPEGSYALPNVHVFGCPGDGK